MVVLSALARELGITFEWVYPVPGHSFLPADRMFGRLEQILRTHDTLLTPDAYFPLFEQVAQVRILGRDWSVYAFKDAIKTYLKAQQKFKISEMKFIRILSHGDIECGRITF